MSAYVDTGIEFRPSSAQMPELGLSLRWSAAASSQPTKTMGCACSSGRTVFEPQDEGGASSHAEASGATEGAALISSGSPTDQLLLSQILQVSTQLSIMASEHGRTEQDLCDAAVAAREQLFSTAADKMTVWCLQPGASGANGQLAAIASDMEGWPWKKIDLDADSPPCTAIRACGTLGAPPSLADLADESVRRELEARYGPAHAIMYVPINVHSEAGTECTQVGVIELVLNVHDGAASSYDASADDGRFSPLRCKQFA